MGSVSDDQPPANTTEKAARMKLLCSHGGKILPKPDGQLRYVGGDTRLVSVKKSVGFAELRSKLEKIFGSNLLLKYQLPNEDLDALISVTCDEDVDNLKEEYDRNEVRDGATRLRAFLFPLPVVSSRSVNSSSDQVKNEAFEHMHGRRPQSNTASNSSSMAFYVPDYLFGFDNAGPHVSHDQVQQEKDLCTPRHFQTLINGSDSSVALGIPLKDTLPTPLQADYMAKQQSSNMDFDGRGVPSSASNHNQRWETEMLLDIKAPGDQKENKAPTESNGDTSYGKSQRDAATELGMNRIPSKDNIAHAYVDGSQADGHSVIERQGNLQPAQHFERNSLEGVFTDAPGVPSDARQDAAPQISRWPHNPSEFQRSMPQLTAAVPAYEARWGLRQSPNSGFDVAVEKPADGSRGSGDSSEGPPWRRETQVSVENAVQPRPISTASEGLANGFKYQDPNGAYEIPTMHTNIESPQHIHQSGKGNVPQVYWQLQDPQVWQQHQVSYEPVQITHSALVSQRLVQPLTSHVASSGADVHLPHMLSTQSNVRSLPQADTLPNARLPSPLHRQGASMGTMHPDQQKPSRASSPLIEHSVGSSSSLVSPRYGHHVMQIHEMGYLPTTIAHQSSGTPVPQVYINPVEAQSLYDQSGGQSHLVEKGVIGNCEGLIGQVKYTDKILLSNHDAAIGSAQYPDNNLQTNQNMWKSNRQDVQGVSLPQDAHALGMQSHQ